MSELPPLVPSDPPGVERVLWRGFEGDLAFDIGARKGENFGHLAQLGYSGIIACEPEPGSYAELVQRFGHWQMIEDDDFPEGTTPWASLMNCAVSDHEGTVELAEVPMAISKGEWVTPGTDGMEWSLPDWGEAKLHAVPCTTLDALADNAGDPDLVVIDTEGHEAAILRGGQMLMAACGTKWLIEFHAPGLKAECETLLTTSDHEVETVRHPHYAEGSDMWHQHGWLRATPRRN
jgi:FkbM family methyltransferase